MRRKTHFPAHKLIKHKYFFPKRANFSDMEIEMFFARYDVDGKFQYYPEENDNLVFDEKKSKYLFL